MTLTNKLRKARMIHERKTIDISLTDIVLAMLGRKYFNSNRLIIESATINMAITTSANAFCNLQTV